jgi:DNA polymerase elongation subunit (family B)
MNQHNFVITNADTDSIMFCKPDQTPFDKEEQQLLINEINSLLPEHIKFANDGVFSKVLILKAKNYAMLDEKGKLKIKGSSLKSASLEPALKVMLNRMVDTLMYKDEPIPEMVNIYNEFIREVRDGIKDIKQWSKKIQLSPTTFNSERTNETKIIDAIQGSEYRSGDRIYVFILPNEDLCLTERYSGQYNPSKYLEKLFKITKRFETFLPVKEIFPNYALKKNQKLLVEL